MGVYEMRMLKESDSLHKKVKVKAQSTKPKRQENSGKISAPVSLIKPNKGVVVVNPEDG